MDEIKYTSVVTQARNAGRVVAMMTSNENMVKCPVIRILSQKMRLSPRLIANSSIGAFLLLVLVNPSNVAPTLTNALGFLSASYGSMRYLATSNSLSMEEKKLGFQRLLDHWVLYGTSIAAESILGNALLEKIIPLWWLFIAAAMIWWLMAPVTSGTRVAKSTGSRSRPLSLNLSNTYPNNSQSRPHLPEPSPSTAYASDSTQVEAFSAQSRVFSASTPANQPGIPIDLLNTAMMPISGVTPSSPAFLIPQTPPPRSVLSGDAPPSPPSSAPRYEIINELEDNSPSPGSARTPRSGGSEDSMYEDPFAEDLASPASRSIMASPIVAKPAQTNYGYTSRTPSPAHSPAPLQVSTTEEPENASPQIAFHQAKPAGHQAEDIPDSPFSPPFEMSIPGSTTPKFDDVQDGKLQKMSLDELLSLTKEEITELGMTGDEGDGRLPSALKKH